MLTSAKRLALLRTRPPARQALAGRCCNDHLMARGHFGNRSGDVMARTYDYDFATGTLREGSPYDVRTRRAIVERLERLSILLDTALVIPGTNIRFGADAIIGLVPGIGDTITTALSAYIVYEAHRLGAPPHLIV